MAKKSKKSKKKQSNSSRHNAVTIEQTMSVANPIENVNNQTNSKAASSSMSEKAYSEEILVREIACEEQEKNLADEQDKLKREKDAFAVEKKEWNDGVEKQKADLKKKWDEINEKDTEQCRKENGLLERETKAKAGFLEENKQIHKKLQDEIIRIEKDGSKIRQRMLKNAEEFEGKLNEILGKCLEDERAQFEKRKALELERISQKAEEQDDREEKLNKREKELKKNEGELKAEKDMHKDDCNNLDARVARGVAAKEEKFKSELKAANELLDFVREEKERLQDVVIEKEKAERMFEGRKPEEVLKEIEELRKEKEDLKEKIGRCLDENERERLQHLEASDEKLSKENRKLRSENSEQRQELDSLRCSVTELENLRNCKDALHLQNELLKRTLEKSTKELQNQLEEERNQSPFPECKKIDEKGENQEQRRKTAKLGSLKEFAERVRAGIVEAETLYYTEQDIRSFIAGMSMSKLILLQGISGTGKTSLPRAFAKAMGANTATIPVQAGWRDKHDLIGHYNTFEKKFHEQEFLQELYRAGSPGYRDLPFFITLDEMNLSHPEQYFADFLSELENPKEDERRIVLMTDGVNTATELLKDGRILPIPPNVWFVGTANHDETTKDFADKTYDRSHIMELERSERFRPSSSVISGSVMFAYLQSAFDDAIKKYRGEATKACDFINNFREVFGEKFNVGWGNRLEDQMMKYVPVIIACGGTVGEASDHILATKLLRKIEGRHSNDASDVEELKGTISKCWNCLEDKTYPSPTMSERILSSELKRLGRG